MSKGLKVILVISTFFLITLNVAAKGREANLEILSELTGKTSEEISVMAEEKTYSEVATDLGVEDAFLKAKTERKLAMIDLRLQEGKITEDEAKEFKLRTLERAKTGCTGEKLNLRIGRNR